jgi:hypothetical protein
MSAVRLSAVLEEDGQVTFTGLPFRRGESVELVVSGEPRRPRDIPHFTGRQILDSGIVGLWMDRDDIGDSQTYARKLREEVETRQR